MSERAETAEPRAERRPPPPRLESAPPGWDRAPRPAEPASEERPPTLVFAAGLAVWGVALAVLLGRCALVG